MKSKSKLTLLRTKSFRLSHTFSWEPYLSKLPNSPGVYFFVSKTNEVLYIGKAKNLKNRVSSYKNLNLLQPKIKSLVTVASKLKYLTCKSEIESLLMEAELIKTHQPKYNSRLKDNKSQIYIVITSESFPRVLLSRKNDLSKYRTDVNIFGPFKSSQLSRKILKFSRKLFPYCNQANNKSIKACFFYHLGLCPGACIGLISKKRYQENIKYLKSFLKGKVGLVNRSLKQKMYYASKNQNFEKASAYRDLIIDINTTIANPLNLIEFSETNFNKLNILKNLWSKLVPFYAKSFKSFPIKPFSRIEAYDVSNISGNQATASMVVFSDGEKDLAEYRRFKIKYVKNYDDALMLAEALYRRLKHRDWKYPDLILVDGGKNQLQATKKVLASHGLHHRIFLIGLAKKQEKVIVYKQTFHHLSFEKNSRELLLLMHIRDEAHRFAKSYHKYLRNKQFFSK